MKTQKVKIESISINPDNPRIIKDSKYQKLIKSIKDFPKMLEIRPIVINEKREVLGGNMRLKACQEIGLEEVFIVDASDLTEEEQREFIIKDNVAYGEWDWEMLANEWSEDVEVEKWGLDTPDNWLEPDEVVEDNYKEPEELEIDIKEGDLIKIGKHKLLCGSSTEVETWNKLMNEEEGDMVMTDPPYNVNYEGSTGMKIQNDDKTDEDFYNFLLDFYNSCASIIKKGGAWYVWHADSEGYNFRKAYLEAGLLMKQCLIWVKNSLVMGRQDYQWKHEPCLYGWKPGDSHYFTKERHHTTVIEDNIDYSKLKKQELLKIVEEMMSEETPSSIIHHDKPTRNDVHPTMKPILLLAPLIRNSSRVGEIVVDGFLGSGSTMVAAHQLKRKCYGMELDPK